MADPSWTEAQDKKTRISKINDDIQKKKKCKEGPKSTMEGGHMLNKLHAKGTMKQQDQGSKDKKRDALQCRAETKEPNATCILHGMSTATKNKESMETHSHVICLQTIENKSMLMQLQAIAQQINASNNEA